MAPMTFSGLHLYLSIILCLLSVFFIGKVNSECQEKYADGLGPNDKRIFTVGERATLKCDVSAEKAIDQIYWKYGNDVMSEASTVVDKFKHKFNVTVTNTTVSGILNKNYTLSWIVELDDSGKYNCTCTTNGIQFPVWVKRPCSKRKHIVTNTTESNITSMAIIEYLRTNQSIEISEKKPLNVSIRLDCLCTWPEIDRTFDGKWKLTTGGDSCTASKQCKAEFPVTLNTTHDTQDNMSSLKPAGCYSGQNTVTYRYQNVFASLGVTFDWKTCLSGQEYGFHIDGGDDPVFKVILDVFPDSCCATLIMCAITGIIMLFCLAALIVMKVYMSRDCKKPKDAGNGVVSNSQDQDAKNEDARNEDAKNEDAKNEDAKNEDAKNKRAKKILYAKIVYGIIIVVGVCCLIALATQCLNDAYCKLRWSRRRGACGVCNFTLPWLCILVAVIVGLGTTAIIVVAVVFMVQIFKPKCLRKNSASNTSGTVTPRQVQTSIKNETNSQLSPRKKKHNALRERTNKIFPDGYCEENNENKVNEKKDVNNMFIGSEIQQSGADMKTGRPLPNQTYANNDMVPRGDRKFSDASKTEPLPNGFSVPVSGGKADQLSNMTPEKHPPTKLDPIVTVPVGCDAVVDENGETPRKHRKKKHKKKKHHKDKSSSAADGTPDHYPINNEDAEGEGGGAQDSTPEHPHSYENLCYENDNLRSGNLDRSNHNNESCDA